MEIVINKHPTMMRPCLLPGQPGTHPWFPAGRWQDQPPGTIYRRITENLRDGRLPRLSFCSASPAR
jgi:hypothetical protein